MGDITRVARDLFHQRGGDKRPLFGWHQEDALQLGHQMAVHMRQLHLIFKIGHRTQAANQDIGLLSAGKVRHQVAKAYDVHIRQVRGSGFRQGNPLLQVEQRLFAGAGGNRQNYRIKHACGTRDDVNVTVGNGIEGTRIDRFCAHGSRFL